MKKLLMGILSSAMLCSSLATSQAASLSSSETGENLEITTATLAATTSYNSVFQDVTTDKWFYPYVTSICQGGYMIGKTTANFYPDDILSVAEFTTMLANAYYGETLAVEKSKENSLWWLPYMVTSYQRGGLENTTIGAYYKSTGTWGDVDTTEISRYDMSMMMYNIMKEQGMNTLSSAEVLSVIQTLPDSVETHYQAAVANAYSFGFLTGKDGNQFKGAESLDRAEAATALFRLVESPLIQEERYETYENNSQSPTLYTVSCMPFVGGTMYASNIQQTAGGTVEVRLVLEEGYSLDGVTLNGTPVTVVDNMISFTMPEKDVVLYAYAVKTAPEVTSYEISYSTPSNGSLSASASQAEAGTMITVQTQANDGFELSYLTMNGTPLSVSSTGSASFTMPEGNVTLVAQYTQPDTLGINLGSVTTTSKQSYTNSIARWASTDYQDIYQVGNQYVVMAASAGTVILTTYDGNHQQVSTHSIAYPLSLFGGFTYGDDGYYYGVFGQSNPQEKDTQEVFRVVKYDKNFQEVGSFSVNGADSYTAIPFDAGSASLTASNGTVVVHASRERYTSSDGYNHQSQFTIVLDSNTMSLKNNLGTYQSNHVSHSFNQFAALDGNTILLVDHGDAYPRSVVLHYSTNGGQSYSEKDLLSIPGSTGANCTGITLGGFEVGSSNYFTVVNRADWNSVTSFTSFNMTGLDKDERDVVLLVTNKSSLSTREITLASYIGSGSCASTPEIVAMSGDQYMVLWEEFAVSDYKSKGVYYAIVDGSGTVVTSKTLYSSEANLNSSATAVYFQNQVMWTMDADSVRTLYYID